MAPSIKVFVQVTLLCCVVTTSMGGISDLQKSFSELENKVKVSQEEIKSLHQIIEQLEKRLEQLEVKDKLLERTRRQNGCNCPPGPKGNRGLPGLVGINGTKGEKGDPGSHGRRGEKGELGLPGSPGPQGPPGLNGTKGERGATGQPGNDGQKGEPGLKGDTGELGRNGTKGERGEKGQPGNVGQKGEPGMKGDTGVPGRNGTNCECGEKGQPGNVGQKCPDPTPRECREAYLNGWKMDGVYTIDPGCGKPFNVFCDMKNGGWTVFQSRMNGCVNFYRNWTDYVAGFGQLQGEHWLGLEKLVCLTTRRPKTELRVDLADEGKDKYAQYSVFSIGNSGTNYTLNIAGYEGTAGDSLKKSNGMQFTTKDRDNDQNDENCASENQGAWWYESCGDSNLNGRYGNDTVAIGYQGVWWSSFLNNDISLKFAQMKLRFRD